MNAIFIVLVFVIIISVVLLTDIVTALQIFSLLASAAVIYRCFTDQPIPQILGESAPTPTPPRVPTPQVKEEFADYPPDAFYGRNFDAYRAYKDTYNSVYTPASFAGGKHSVDDMGVNIGVARARDRQCLDGLITKNANFYKYHYGDELNDYERRAWWGRNEY